MKSNTELFTEGRQALMAALAISDVARQQAIKCGYVNGDCLRQAHRHLTNATSAFQSLSERAAGVEPPREG